MENYYQLLGLSPSASKEEIRKLIHSQIRLWSSRTNAPHISRRQEAERMLKLLETMEEILLDDQKKVEYDRNFLLEQESSGTGWAEEEIMEALTEGFRLLKQNRSSDALFLAMKLIEHVQDRADAWALLGLSNFAAGEQAAAIEPMVKACKLAPERASYFFQLGEIYQELNRLSLAEEAYEQAIKLAPEETKFQYALGALYMQHGNYKDGLHLLEQSVKSDPQNESYKEELVRAYLDIAFSTWKEIGEDHPNLSPGFYPTSQADLTMAYIYVKRATALNIKNEELVNQMKQSKVLIRNRKGRQFTGSWLIALVSMAELVLIQHYNPSMINVVLIGLLPLLYIFATFTPRYRVYYWATNQKSTRTDFGYLLEIVRSKLKGFGLVIIYLFAALPFIYLINPDYFVVENGLFRGLNFYFYLVNTVFPIVMIINLFRNYIRKPI